MTLKDWTERRHAMMARHALDLRKCEILLEEIKANHKQELEMWDACKPRTMREWINAIGSGE